MAELGSCAAVSCSRWDLMTALSLMGSIADGLCSTDPMIFYPDFFDIAAWREDGSSECVARVLLIWEAQEYR